MSEDDIALLKTLIKEVGGTDADTEYFTRISPRNSPITDVCIMLISNSLIRRTLSIGQ